MKLLHRVALNLTLVLLPIIALWAIIFYHSMIEEINDEADDSLADYAEMIIRRQLAGYPLPPLNSGSNNSYTIIPLETAVEPFIKYHDEMVFIPEEEDTEPARVLTTVYPDNNNCYYKLTVAMPTFERDDLRNAIFWYVVALSAVMVLTILVATTLIFQRSMRPLYALLRWFDKYSPGKITEKIPDSDVHEFHKLSLAAQTAVNRAEEHFQMQKQFIGNASHELQTPLAVIGNRIEWLIDNTAINEEQYTELSKIQHTLNRLVRLNRTLLLLTKIDNGQFPETSSIDIAALIRSEIEIYDEIYSHRNIQHRTDAPESVNVKMNETLAGILITNLIKNAFVHSPDESNIKVKLQDDTLEIANSGSAPLDAEKIFDRFYHDGKSGSTGLGLALVNSICRYYGLTTEYRFEHERHIFKIKGFHRDF